ncbi:hypothetical protein V8F33_010868 [Rhypophila sp. PSN 637]
MKIISLFIALFSLLGLTTAQGSVMPAVACTPTGPGVCTVGVAGLVYHGTGSESTTTHAKRSAASTASSNYLPVGVTSQLPYVLILDYLSYSNYNYMEFRYSSHTFRGTPYCRRHTMAGGSVIHTCQSAFNC